MGKGGEAEGTPLGAECQLHGIIGKCAKDSCRDAKVKQTGPQRRSVAALATEIRSSSSQALKHVFHGKMPGSGVFQGPAGAHIKA